MGHSTPIGNRKRLPTAFRNFSITLGWSPAFRRFSAQNRLKAGSNQERPREAALCAVLRNARVPCPSAPTFLVPPKHATPAAAAATRPALPLYPSSPHAVK